MTTAANATPNAAAYSERDLPLPLRSDTFLGVCEAVGQDLGFNPNWLRVAFAALLLWNPEVILAAYLGLGIVVAATRMLLPDRRSEARANAQAEAVRRANDGEEEVELLAA